MLNPLLTMGVQYLVFSNLFRWDVDNYAVYLLAGTVAFNFMTEATQSSLVSVTNSANLITKVYIPTYVFPISKVFSATINLCFSTLALYMILFLQGLSLNVYHLLIPFLYLCLMLFACGLGMVLAALMVYFRDVQFLYNVVVVLWTYLTPLFYPVSIIPESLMGIYTLNPMYHYVTFFRTLLLEARIPAVSEFAWIMGCAALSMLVGLTVFRKLKKNFVLYV